MRRQRDDLHPHQYNDGTWHTEQCLVTVQAAFGYKGARNCYCTSVSTLNTQPTKAECLSSIDDLRAAVERGSVVAFAAVGIETDDKVSFWCGATNPGIRRIKLLGAISQMNHDALNGSAFSNG